MDKKLTKYCLKCGKDIGDSVSNYCEECFRYMIAEGKNTQQPLKTSPHKTGNNSYGAGEREPPFIGGNGAITNGELEAHQPSLLPAETSFKDKKNNWIKENKPKLKKLGFRKVNPFIYFIKNVSLVILIILLIFGGYYLYKNPNAINGAIQCNQNVNMTCPEIPACNPQPCNCGSCNCDCGNTTILMPNIINLNVTGNKS